MLRRRLMVMATTACVVALTCWSTAQAQINLSGSWQNWIDQDFDLRLNGPWPDTYMGIPINKAGQTAAVAYSTETLSEIDRQCEPYNISYEVVGPWGPQHIWPTMSLDGTVVAWNIGGQIDALPITIWVDGHLPPSDQAARSPQGFTTGHWIGDTLVASTTHIRHGYLTRNGVPSSDQQTVTIFITRHENALTFTEVIHDPIYLAAPYVLSDVLTENPTGATGTGADMDATCSPEEEAENVANNQVPTYLTPPQDLLMYATLNYGIPHSAAMGGPQTMYPEYTRQLASLYKRPQAYCKTNCCGEVGEAPDGTSTVTFNRQVVKCNLFLP
jgi:hypothetical protein